jgi:hypothetical protein
MVLKCQGMKLKYIGSNYSRITPLFCQNKDVYRYYNGAFGYYPSWDGPYTVLSPVQGSTSGL